MNFTSDIPVFDLGLIPFPPSHKNWIVVGSLRNSILTRNWRTKWIAWNGSNEIGRKELGRPFWSINLGRIDWGRIGSNGLGSKSICCLPWTWHFSRSTQVHSTQFRNGENSTHGRGGRFDPFLSTHFRSPEQNIWIIQHRTKNCTEKK